MATATTLLAALETAIETFLNNGAVEEYEVDGMTFRRSRLSEMMRMRDQLKAEKNAVDDGKSMTNYFRRGKV